MLSLPSHSISEINLFYETFWRAVDCIIGETIVRGIAPVR